MNITQCERCGLSRTEGHPIKFCFGCEKDAYGAAFAELRAARRDAHLLGYDPYSDCIYVWTDGVVVAIEGRADRIIRLRKTDEMVRRITDLETENRDVLAENARLRRRLETDTKGVTK